MTEDKRKQYREAIKALRELVQEVGAIPEYGQNWTLLATQMLEDCDDYLDEQEA